MKWDDFNKADLQATYVGQVKTDIDCPICGNKVLWDSRIIVTSLPPKFYYWCTCGWCETSYRKWGKEYLPKEELLYMPVNSVNQ